MTTKTRDRPRSLPSITTRLQTGMGNLFVTVSVDEDGEPFEVFGHLGKGGSFQNGVTELACRCNCSELVRYEHSAAFEEGIEASGPPGSK